MGDFISEIRQDIVEFPMEGLGIFLFLIVISLAFAYSMRGIYERRCKHKFVIGIFCTFLFFILAFGIEPHPFLFKETEHSLDKKIIILMYHNRKKGDERTGYCYMDDKKIHYLKFFLCGYSNKVKPYIGKEIEILCKNNVVYQLSYKKEIIFYLERSNEKVWLGQIRLFLPYILLICPCFMMYCNLLKIFNEK